MKRGKIPPALATDAIFGKSKVYIRKALLRKSSGDLAEYQLWASLALELLGKASLASIHPSLIADPQHYQSLFAASGLNVSTDIKTIGAHTLYQRLRLIHREFDEQARKFCELIALRRNAELHSGESPFRSIRANAWEAQYWHCCQLILASMASSLEEWLGVEQASAPKEIIKLATEAKQQAVNGRVERAAESFNGRKSKDKRSVLEVAARKRSTDYRGLFTLLGDLEWEYECPACKGKAFMAGIQVEEEVLDSFADEYEAWEEVEKCYHGEQFACPVCNLFLDGQEELEMACLDQDYSEIETREMEYEPDYGNE